MLKRGVSVFGVVRGIFERYGFEPLQTPTLERRETLFGEYGEDAGDLTYSASHQRSNEEVAMR
jgi:histidyl-tRNA synthetase